MRPRTPSSHRHAAGLTALVLATSLLAARPAEATNTRVFTLGTMNRFIIDDANRWLYPHVITRYGHLFYVELFGTAPSAGTTAPDSQRSTNDAPGLYDEFGSGGVPGGALTAADFMPVQSRAGAGAIIGITEDLFVSFHLSDYENPLVRGFLEGPVATVSAGDPNAFPWLAGQAAIRPVSDANRKLDLFAAYKLLDLLDLGLLFSYGSSSFHYRADASDPNVPVGAAEQDQAVRGADDIGSSELRFLLSAGSEISTAFAVDAAFGLALHTLTYRPNGFTNRLEGGNGLELQADARATIGLTKWWELVPAISLRSVGFSGADLANYTSGLIYNDNGVPGRELANITDVKSSAFLLDAGLAAHMRPFDFVDFWGAVGFQTMAMGFQYAHIEPEGGGVVRDDPLESFERSRSVTSLYLRAGLEARLFSWLDFRGGVVKYLRGDSVAREQTDAQDATNDRDNGDSRDQPFFDYFLGFAAHYEGFFLDLQLDPFFFQRGPQFLSGSGGNMFVNASLGYRY